MSFELPCYTDVVEELVEEGHVLIRFTPRSDPEFVYERELRYRAKGYRVTIHYEQLRRNA